MKSTSIFLFWIFCSSLINQAQSQLPFKSDVDIDIEKVIYISKKAFGLVNSDDKRFLVDEDGSKMSLPKDEVYLATDGLDHVLTGIVDNDNGRTGFSLLRVRNNQLEVVGTVDLIGFWTYPLFTRDKIYITNMWEGSGNLIKAFDFDLSEVFQVEPLEGRFFEQFDYGQTSSGVQAIIQNEGKVYLIKGINTNSTTKKELEIDHWVVNATFGSSMILLKLKDKVIALDSQGILQWEYGIVTNRYPLVYDEKSKQIVVFSRGQATVLNDQGILSGRITYSDYLPSKPKVIPVSVEFPMDDVSITIGELMPTNHHNYMAKNAIQISIKNNEVLLRYSAPIYLKDL